MVHTQRKGTDKIDDPKKCDMTFSKRSYGLTKKGDALYSLTRALVAIIVVSRNGEFCFFSSPFTEEKIAKLLLPKSPKKGVDWAKKACNSCTTKEDCTSLIIKYLEVVVSLHKKLKDFQNSPSVNASAGHQSGVGAGRHPSTLAFTEHGDDCDISLTSLADSAATRSESLGMESNRMVSDPESAVLDLARLAELVANDNDIQTLLWGSNPEGNENNADDIFAGLQSLGVL